MPAPRSRPRRGCRGKCPGGRQSTRTPCRARNSPHAPTVSSRVRSRPRPLIRARVVVATQMEVEHAAHPHLDGVRVLLDRQPDGDHRALPVRGLRGRPASCRPITDHRRSGGASASSASEGRQHGSLRVVLLLVVRVAQDGGVLEPPPPFHAVRLDVIKRQRVAAVAAGPGRVRKPWLIRYLRLRPPNQNGVGLRTPCMPRRCIHHPAQSRQARPKRPCVRPPSPLQGRPGPPPRRRRGGRRCTARAGRSGAPGPRWWGWSRGSRYARPAHPVRWAAAFPVGRQVGPDPDDEGPGTATARAGPSMIRARPRPSRRAPRARRRACHGGHRHARARKGTGTRWPRQRDTPPGTPEPIRIDRMVETMENPKGHDGPRIRGGISAFGFVDQPVVDERTGRLVHGHGRMEQLLAMLENGKPAGRDHRRRRGALAVAGHPRLVVPFGHQSARGRHHAQPVVDRRLGRPATLTRILDAADKLEAGAAGHHRLLRAELETLHAITGADPGGLGQSNRTILRHTDRNGVAADLVCQSAAGRARPLDRGPGRGRRGSGDGHPAGIGSQEAET